MARRASRQSRSSNTASIPDLSDVEVGRGGFHIEPGDYELEVESVKQGVSQNDNEQLEWVFKGISGKSKGKKFFFYTPLVEQSLWKLRETLETLGIEIPDSAWDQDLSEWVGSRGVAVIEDDEYQGKLRSKISGFLANGEAAEEADDEPEKTAKPSRNGKKKAPPKISKEEVQEMSEDEIEALCEKYDLDIDLTTYKTLRKKIAAVLIDLEEQELLEDEEPEEETTTTRRRR